eukprot:EG_transcript_6401
MAAYSKVLRRFFLKVHPDLFQQLPEQQRINAQSFQKLQALLDWHRRLKAGKPGPAPPADTLTFHCRAENVTQIVVSEWKPPPLPLSTTDTTRADAAVEGLIHALLQQAGLHEGPEQPKAPAEHLIENFATSLRNCWADARTPTVDDLVAADLVRVSRALSPHHTLEGLLRLHKHLPSLQYHRWYGVPILLTDHYSATDVPGFLSIPWDFAEDTCLEFILANLDVLLAEQQAVLQQAETQEAAVRAIQGALGLAALALPAAPQSSPWQYAVDAGGEDAPSSSSTTSPQEDVSATVMAPGCSTSDKLPMAFVQQLQLSNPHTVQRALGVLQRAVPDVKEAFDLQGLAWELGPRWGVRQNGHICLSLPALLSPEGPDKLLQFLRRIEPDMEAYCKQTRESQQLQRLIELYVTRLEALLRCTVDVSHPTSYVKKVVFLQELWRLAYHLTEWNWDTYRFELGDSVDLDWEGRRLVLPYDIDAFKVLTYIRMYLRELFHPNEAPPANDTEVWMYGARSEPWAGAIDPDDASAPPPRPSKGAAGRSLQRPVTPAVLQAASEEAQTLTDAAFEDFARPPPKPKGKRKEAATPVAPDLSPAGSQGRGPPQRMADPEDEEAEEMEEAEGRPRRSPSGRRRGRSPRRAA